MQEAKHCCQSVRGIRTDKFPPNLNAKQTLARVPRTCKRGWNMRYCVSETHSSPPHELNFCRVSMHRTHHYAKDGWKPTCRATDEAALHIDSRFQPSSLTLLSKNGISKLILLPPAPIYREHDPATAQTDGWTDGRTVEIVSLGYCDTSAPPDFGNRSFGSTAVNKEVRSPSLRCWAYSRKRCMCVA